VQQLDDPPAGHPPAPFGFAYIAVNVSVPSASVVVDGFAGGKVHVWPMPSYKTTFKARVSSLARIGKLVLLVNVLKLSVDPEDVFWDDASDFALEISEIQDVAFPCPKAAKALQTIVRFDVCGCVQKKVVQYANDKGTLGRLSKVASEKAKSIVRSKVLDAIRNALPGHS